MTAAARKPSSKPTRRISKRQPSRAKLALVKDERIVRRLEDNPHFKRMVQAVVERYLATADKAEVTDAQMAARRRSYQRALEHNDPPSDEAVAAIKREWG